MSRFAFVLGVIAALPSRARGDDNLNNILIGPVFGIRLSGRAAVRA